MFICYDLVVAFRSQKFCWQNRKRAFLAIIGLPFAGNDTPGTIIFTEFIIPCHVMCDISQCVDGLNVVFVVV